MQSKIKIKNDLKQILAKFLLVVFFASILPKEVYALSLTAVPIDNPGLGLGGVEGEVAARASETALTLAATHVQQCALQEAASQPIDSVSSAALPGLDFITGGAEQLSYVSQKLGTVNLHLACREIDRTALANIPAVNLLVQQKKQQLMDETTLAIKNLQNTKEQLLVQQRLAKTGFWKTIFVKLLINVSKNVAMRLVNLITNNYKVNDFARYASVLGAQVYTTQYIREKAPTGRDQLMIRSMLSNPLLRDKVPSAAYQRASDALVVDNIPYKAEEISWDDPKFYLKLNKVFAADAQPEVVTAVLRGQANEISNSANVAAKTEINASNGIKSPHTCNDVASQQKNTDNEWYALDAKIEDRQKLVTSLQNELSLLKNSTAEIKKKLTEDLAKAQADLDSANKELANVDSKYGNNAVAKFCEGVATPGNLVNQGIDKLVSSLISKASDFSDNNLSTVQTTLANLATNLFDNLLFGSKTGSSLVNEITNSANPLTSLVVNSLSAQSIKKKLEQKQANMEKGVDFDWDSGNTSSEYILTWNVDTKKVTNASYVSIAGTGISPTQKLPLTGSYTVQSSQPGIYLMKVFAATGTTPLVTVSVETESETNVASVATQGGGSVCGGNYSSLQACVAQSGDQNYCASICGTVQGAFITKAIADIRGPSGIFPRGATE
jgi:hypothetical protein